MNGYTKPYFLDETGRLWRDETGNLDGVDTIPFEVELGRVDNGTPLKKSYTGCVVQSEKAKAAMVLVSVDNGNWKNIGQVTEDNQAFKLPAWAVGRDINYKLIYNNQGDGPIFDGITSFFSVDEVKIG